MSRAVVVFLAGLAVFAGCGTYEVRRVAAPAKVDVHRAAIGAANGTVCVARLDDDGTGAAVPVWDNAVLVGAATRGSHFCWPATAGRHFLSSELLVTAELTVDVRAGSTSWVLLEADSSLRHAGVGSRGYRSGRRRESVKLVAADDAKGEVWRASTAQVELVDVPLDQTPPPRVPIPAAR